MKETPKVEKRIYVVIPSFLIAPGLWLREYIPMSCGRAIAQACHVVSKLKLRLKLDPDEENTTIVLRVTDSNELEKVRDKISRSRLPWEEFLDTNPGYYKTEKSILTAVAICCSRKKGKSLFHGYDAWTCDTMES